ncbi:MAG TPA: hypothetical protein VIL63_04715 [Terriglobales bacterium]
MRSPFRIKLDLWPDAQSAQYMFCEYNRAAALLDFDDLLYTA